MRQNVKSGRKTSKFYKLMQRTKSVVNTVDAEPTFRKD